MRGALTPRGSSGPSPRLSQAGWNERVHWLKQFITKGTCGDVNVDSGWCCSANATRDGQSLAARVILIVFASASLAGGIEMILVTGASGTVGKAVLAEVARSGEKHRAMYRSKEDAAKAPAGTEVVIADFSDKASLASALRGVESVYLV